MINQELLTKLYEADSANLEQILPATPQPVLPIITQSDSDAGYVFRYFVRQVTDKNFIVEVDKSQYERFKENPRFVTAEIKWKIVGKLETIIYPNGVPLNGVKDQNRLTVSNADLTFGGLYRYITNYDAYWLRE